VLAVAEVLAERSPGEPLVGFGHSKGGAALLLAEQRAPGTFDALYLYEPVVFPATPTFGGPGEHPLATGALRRRRTFTSKDEAFENYAAKPPFNALRADALRAYVQHGFADDPEGGVTLKCAPEHEAQVYRMGITHDAFAHLGEVACPVVVARGAFGDPGPVMVAEAIADALPQGRLHVFDDLGHFGPMEDPDRIADDLLDLLTPG
jgi:pimeloyl-ACP methyl ester carboxylesterase